MYCRVFRAFAVEFFILFFPSVLFGFCSFSSFVRLYFCVFYICLCACFITGTCSVKPAL